MLRIASWSGWFVTAVLSPCPVLAQDETQRRIPPAALARPPVIDGAIGADEWAGAAVAERFFDRRRGGLAADQTIVRIASDETAI